MILADFGNSHLGPLVHLLPKTFYLFGLQSFDFERRLFQKRVMHINLGIRLYFTSVASELLTVYIVHSLQQTW